MSVLVFGQVTGGNQSAAASLGLNLVTTVPANAVLVVAIAADNAGASGASAISSVSDNFGLGNVWSLVKAQNRTAGSAANDGCTAALYVSRVPGIVDVSAGTKTVTVNFSPNVTAKAVAIVHVTGVEDIAYSTNGVSGTGTTYNSAATASASMAVGDLFLGVVASESNTIPTADSDSTGGTWGSAQTAQSGGAGGDATKMSVSLQFKLPSGSGAQTLNGACANSDWAVAWGLFTVPVAKSDTETGAAVDAGSVNTGAQPSDTETGAAVDAGESVSITQTASDTETGAAADAGESIAATLADAETGTALDEAGMSVSAAAGTSGGAGVNTNGPQGGAGGAVVDSVGTTRVAGAVGGAGSSGAGSLGGGGGAGAGASSGAAVVGNPGSGATPGTGGVGAGSTGSDGQTAGFSSSTGGTPGAGSGGGGSSAAAFSSPGSGGPPRVRFTYSPSNTVRTYTSAFSAAVGVESAPAGDTSVLVECWGAGGAGSSGTTATSSGGGGGSGAYASRTIALSGAGTERFQYSWPQNIANAGIAAVNTVVTLVPTVAVTAAPSSGDGNLGGPKLVEADSGLCGQLASAGGAGGAGGLAANSIGTTKFDGGSGGAGGAGIGTQTGGGGGGSGGSASAGNPGNNAGTGGAAVTDGGAGGDGGIGTGTSGATGTPAGAGGGGGSTAGNTGAIQFGKPGRVRFTYQPSGTVHTYDTAGEAVETIIGGSTSVLIECWGGSGSGGFGQANTRAGGGGGGGAYAAATRTIGSETTYSYCVGRFGQYINLVEKRSGTSFVSLPLADDGPAESIAATLTDAETGTGADAGEALAVALTDAELAEAYDGRVFDASAWGSVLEELDFSDTSKITSSGGLVTQVDPTSGSLAASVTSSGSNRPQTGVDTQNGLNVLTFDGTDDWLDANVVDQAQPVTLVAVFKSNTTDAQNRQILANSSGAGDGNQPTIYSRADGPTVTWPSGEWRFFAGAEYGTGVAVDTNPHVAVAIFDDTAGPSQFWLDGVLLADESVLGGSPGTEPLKRIALGGEVGGGNPFFGWIAHGVWYAGHVSDPAGLSGALNAKWAVYGPGGSEDVAATSGSTPITDTETAAAADAGESLAAALADADTGAAVDAGESASVGLQDAETGAGSDAGESVAAAVTDTESGSSDESGAVAVATSDADTGAGAESEAVAAALADTETGSSSDAGEALAVGLTETETGSSIDTESALAAALTDAETGSAVDAESSASSISDTETGSATDDGAVAAAVTDTEAGSSAEGQSLAVLVTDADIAGFFEEESVAAYLQDADTGAAVDAGESLVIVLPNVRGHIDVDSTNTGAVATARAGTGLVQITTAPGPTSLVLTVAGAAITTSSQSSGRISIDVQEAPQ